MMNARILAIALVASAGCNLQISTDVEAKDTWTRSYPITATGTLSITSGNGRITVEAAETDTIEVTAERFVRAATEELAQEQLAQFDMREDVSPDRVSIDSSTRGLTINVSRRVNYTVRVPASLAAELRSSNGEISVTGLTGRLAASATNGRITGTDLRGAVRASTTNGVVALTMAALAADGVTADTTNGQVTITVPRSISATVSARVTNGAITHENLDLQIVESSRRRLDGRVGGGGPMIEVSTTNGAVRFVGR